MTPDSAVQFHHRRFMAILDLQLRRTTTDQAEDLVALLRHLRTDPESPLRHDPDTQGHVTLQDIARVAIAYVSARVLEANLPERVTPEALAESMSEGRMVAAIAEALGAALEDAVEHPVVVEVVEVPSPHAKARKGHWN